MNSIHTSTPITPIMQAHPSCKHTPHASTPTSIFRRCSVNCATSARSTRHSSCCCCAVDLTSPASSLVNVPWSFDCASSRCCWVMVSCCWRETSCCWWAAWVAWVAAVSGLTSPNSSRILIKVSSCCMHACVWWVCGGYRGVYEIVCELSFWCLY